MTVISHLFWGWYLFRRREWVWRFACATVLPDCSYVVLLGYYSVRLHVNGLTNLSLWDVAWRSPIVCALHSFVPWAATAAVVSITCGRRLRRWLLPVWAGWFSHIFIDMLTHRSDGYPIFYPLSAYRFPTPISYWEPAYHGHVFALIDSMLMAVLLVHYLLRWRGAASRATEIATSVPRAAGR